MVRLVVIGVMLASLTMAIAIPQAFGGRALLFAGSYVAIQVGRTAFLAFAAAGRGTLERARAERILSGSSPPGRCGSPARWPTGSARTALWLGCAGPRLRRAAHRVPRARPQAGGAAAGTWQTAHFAERFQLFVIIALGESIVLTGARRATSSSAWRA